MGIDTKVLKGLRHQIPNGELGVCVEGDGAGSLAVTSDGFSYVKEGVVINGVNGVDEALVSFEGGSQLFKFDSSGAVVSSLLVDGGGNTQEARVDDPITRRNLARVREAQEHSEMLFANLEGYRIKGLFDS